MDRRTVLGAAGSTWLLTMAGCTTLASPTTLSPPRLTRDDHGETHLHFEADDKRVSIVTVQPGRQRYSGSGGDTLDVDVQLWHTDETKITSLRLALRAPPTGPGVPAQIALTAPQWNPHPPIELFTHPDEGSTVFEIDEIGGQGKGTMTFEFTLTSLAASTSELLVDITANLTTQGILTEPITIDGRAHVPVPDGGDSS